MVIFNNHGWKRGILPRRCILDMISGVFDITAETMDGAAARADDGEECRGYNKQYQTFT